MMTAEDNRLLTSVGPGTAMGRLLRSYWQPVAMETELDGGAPCPVRVLGEDLVLFRDDAGGVGLLGLHCAHRGTDLSYGRVEDGGLRCIYHGWLYDRRGRCLEQPGEPRGSDFHERVRQLSYPCQVRAGLVFAYLGSGEPPLLPDYEFLRADAQHRKVVKILHACSFLQANEGNMDQVHLSFLHRLAPGSAYGSMTAVAGGTPGTNTTAIELLGDDRAPRIETEATHYGMREYVVRHTRDGYYLKVENFVMPNLCAVPGPTASLGGYLVNWHVPIDDVSHWKYMFAFSGTAPLDRAFIMREIQEAVGPTGVPDRQRANRYRQDRAEMRTATYAGLGKAFAIHDLWATERQGPIQDRTDEHLGYEDRSITMMRSLLREGLRDVENGRTPRHVIRDASRGTVDDIVVLAEVVGPEPVQDWRGFLHDRLRRRAGA